MANSIKLKAETVAQIASVKKAENMNPVERLWHYRKLSLHTGGKVTPALVREQMGLTLSQMSWVYHQGMPATKDGSRLRTAPAERTEKVNGIYKQGLDTVLAEITERIKGAKATIDSIDVDNLALLDREALHGKLCSLLAIAKDSAITEKMILNRLRYSSASRWDNAILSNVCTNGGKKKRAVDKDRQIEVITMYHKVLKRHINSLIKYIENE